MKTQPRAANGTANEPKTDVIRFRTEFDKVDRIIEGPLPNSPSIISSYRGDQNEVEINELRSILLNGTVTINASKVAMNDNSQNRESLYDLKKALSSVANFSEMDTDLLFARMEKVYSYYFRNAGFNDEYFQDLSRFGSFFKDTHKASDEIQALSQDVQLIDMAVMLGIK